MLSVAQTFSEHKFRFVETQVLLCYQGHWAGVVGDAELRRANFSMGLSLTYERSQSVDFCRMYFRDPMTFVTAMSRPTPLWMKLITPFNGEFRIKISEKIR